MSDQNSWYGKSEPGIPRHPILTPAWEAGVFHAPYQPAKYKRANPASTAIRLNDFDGLNDEIVRDGRKGLSQLGCGWHNPLPGLRIRA